MLGEQLVVLFHTGAGQEFLHKLAKDLMIEKSTMQTKTAGYDPKANGESERHVEVTKHKATSDLSSTQITPAVLLLGCQASSTHLHIGCVGHQAPGGRTDLWPHSIGQGSVGRGQSLARQTKEELFLCWDNTTVQ